MQNYIFHRGHARQFVCSPARMQHAAAIDLSLYQGCPVPQGEIEAIRDADTALAWRDTSHIQRGNKSSSGLSLFPSNSGCGIGFLGTIASLIAAS